jgi:hypothetical protein
MSKSKEERIKELERRIRELEQRVATLEAKMPPIQYIPPYISPPEPLQPEPTRWIWEPDDNRTTAVKREWWTE